MVSDISSHPLHTDRAGALNVPGTAHFPDVFVGLATINSHLAPTDPNHGTYFIQELTKCLQTYYEKNTMEEIFAMAKSRVEEKIHDVECFDYIHMPDMKSTLRFRLFLVNINIQITVRAIFVLIFFCCIVHLLHYNAISKCTNRVSETRGPSQICMDLTDLANRPNGPVTHCNGSIKSVD